MRHDRYMRRSEEEARFHQIMEQLEKKEKKRLTDEEYEEMVLKGR